MPRLVKVKSEKEKVKKETKVKRNSNPPPQEALHGVDTVDQGLKTEMIIEAIKLYCLNPC